MMYFSPDTMLIATLNEIKEKETPLPDITINSDNFRTYEQERMISHDESLKNTVVEL